jgi:hypothetical protein
MLLTYFLNDFEMAPVAPIITGITLLFYIPHALYFYCKVFKIFTAYFLITYLSPEIATSINIHVLFSLSWIIMSGLLLEMVLSVCICWFYNMVYIIIIITIIIIIIIIIIKFEVMIVLVK